jgi:hypothetical protein
VRGRLDKSEEISQSFRHAGQWALAVASGILGGGDATSVHDGRQNFSVNVAGDYIRWENSGRVGVEYGRWRTFAFKRPHNRVVD